MLSVRGGAFLIAIAGAGAACGASSESSSPSATSSGGGPGGSTTCEASAAADIEVSNDDLNGFPPYAVAACTLVYVSTTGELVARDLGSKNETLIAPSSEHPRRPTASAELIAWEADEQGRSVVRVRSGNTSTTVQGSFSAAGEPRASGGSVAFTAWLGPSKSDDTDVWLYEAKAASARMVIGGPGQQRFSDVSAKYVVASDFGEELAQNPADGRFDNNGRDLADIVVFDRSNGAVTTRRLPQKQAFPMLANDDALAYLAWTEIHPEPKFTQYELRGGPILANPAADRRIAEVSYTTPGVFARPAVANATIEWIANPEGRTTLYRAPADGSGPPIAVNGLADLRLYAPAPSAAGFTILATSRVGATEIVARLRGVAR